MCPPNSHIEALTYNTTIFENGAYEEEIKIKWPQKGRTVL